MARWNLNKLRKSDIVWLYYTLCKAHSMSYLEHPGCYERESPSCSPFAETIGFLDIETTSLNASFGYVLSYCIKELDGPISECVLTPDDIRNYRFDERLIRKFVVDMKKFDRFVVHWGKDRRHDIPFLRTRALYWGVPFPKYAEHYVTDTWDIMKAKLKLHSNRLQTFCDMFGIPSKGHRLIPPIWHKAQAGDEESLQFVLEHNREDVISTEAAWKKIHDFVRESRTSF